MSEKISGLPNPKEDLNCSNSLIQFSRPMDQWSYTVCARPTIPMDGSLALLQTRDVLYSNLEALIVSSNGRGKLEGLNNSLLPFLLCEVRATKANLGICDDHLSRPTCKPEGSSPHEAI